MSWKKLGSGWLALFLCVALLIAMTPALFACGGGNGRTIAQTGGSCGGGGAPANFGSGGSINPAPVPEFSETTTRNDGYTMSSLVPASQARKPAAPAYAARLPIASPSKSAVTTTTNGRNTLQMAGNAKASEVPFAYGDSLTTTTDGKNTRQMASNRAASSTPYVASDSVTTTTDGTNTRQMKSDRAASTVPIEANADRSKPGPEVPKPTSIRLTYRK